MNKELVQLVHKAITIDENYIENILEIHKLLNGIEKKQLILTTDGIVERNQIIPKERN